MNPLTKNLMLAFELPCIQVGTERGIVYDDCVKGQGAQMPSVPSIAASTPGNSVSKLASVTHQEIRQAA